jgi:hypothetical protein
VPLTSFVITLYTGKIINLKEMTEEFLDAVNKIERTM